MHKKSGASSCNSSPETTDRQFHNLLIHKGFMFCQFSGQRKQTLVPQGFAARAGRISTKLSTASVNT
jgi:hypothetical protein